MTCTNYCEVEILDFANNPPDAVVKFYSAICYLWIGEGIDIPRLEGLTPMNDRLLNIFAVLHVWVINPVRKLFRAKNTDRFPVQVLCLLNEDAEGKLGNSFFVEE